MKMTVVFLLRVDSMTGKGEGEAYYAEKKGVINCNVWNTPNLTDQQVIIANGKAAIHEVYEQYQSTHHIIKVTE